MDILRISIAEAANGFLVGELPSGETVTVSTFYNLKNSSSPVLTSNACTEHGTTGLYFWSFSNIGTAPTIDMVVLWRMSASPSGRTEWGLLYIGGYPNVISDQTDKMVFSGDNITAAVMSIATGRITADSIEASALNNKGNWNVGKTGYALTAATGLGNQTADITGNLSGSVGSVTGNVAGHVVGSVGSVAPDGIGAASIADGAITGPKIATSGVEKIVGSATALDGGAATIAGMLVKMADDNAGAVFDATTDSLEKIAGSTATPPTVEQISTQMERVGGMLEAAKNAAVSSLEEGEEINAKLEVGSLAPDSVQFEATI